MSKLCKRTSVIITAITADLSFSEWDSAFGDAKMTTALLGRLTRHRHMPDTANDSLRFNDSSAHEDKAEKEKITTLTIAPAPQDT